MNNQKLWDTQINALDPITGELKLYKGPPVPAENIEEAIEYCRNNGLGYCKVTGGPIIVLQFNDKGHVDLDKSIIPNGFDQEIILAICNDKNKQMENLQHSNDNPQTTPPFAVTTTNPAPAPRWGTIKEFREVIDQAMNSFPLLRSSREISLTFTSLQRAFSWLGLAQAATGSETPYKESENPASTTIEPTADHSTLSFGKRWEPLGTHTARVKDFRSIFTDIITDFRLFQKHGPFVSPNYQSALNEALVSIRDAKTWLGWELARIKKETEGTINPVPARELPL